MFYRIAADLVVIVHFLFILFAVFGALMILYRRVLIWLQVPAMLWAAAISFGGWICPLTYVENYFRRLAGGQGYRGGFVEQYLIPLIYPENFDQQLATILGVCVLVINAVIYTIVYIRVYR